MIQFEKLGMILSPKDKLHAKFNTGAHYDGNVVHLLYRWAELPGPASGIALKYVQNFLAYASMTPEGKLLREALGGRIKKSECEMAVMFVADRIAHNLDAENGIKALTERGIDVVCDRDY